jgi:hypothetical protein
MHITPEPHQWFLQAHVEQWMDFAATEVDPGVAWYLYPRLGYIPYAQTVSYWMGNLDLYS